MDTITLIGQDGEKTLHLSILWKYAHIGRFDIYNLDAELLNAYERLFCRGTKFKVPSDGRIYTVVRTESYTLTKDDDGLALKIYF